MGLKYLACPVCGSIDLIEIKPNTYACRACEGIFKYQDPNRTEVAPQFCEEDCGNPVKYKCTLCGKMVCEGHGEKAKVLFAKMAFTEQQSQNNLINTTVPELQQAWCLQCFVNMSYVERSKHLTNVFKDSDSSVRDACCDAFESIGASSVTALCEAYEHGDSDIRNYSIYALYRVSDSSIDANGVAVLCKALSETNAKTRIIAAYALKDICSPSSVPALCEALQDGESDVRRCAAEALAHIADPSSVTALCRSVRDIDVDVCRLSANALAKIADPSSVPALCEALKDGDNDVRLAAATALRNIGDESGLCALENARKKWFHEFNSADGFYRSKEVIFAGLFILGIGLPVGIYGLKYYKYPENKVCLTLGSILVLETLCVLIFILINGIWAWLVVWIVAFFAVSIVLAARWNYS